MTAPFECEVRVRLDDIEAFHRRLADLGAMVSKAYAFTDHYYRPASPAGWDPGTRAVRIREHVAPEAVSELLLTHVEMSSANGLRFKRSLFREGKLRLYRGSLADCRSVLESLGFVPWISVRKRDGRLFEIPGLGSLVTEHVEGVGWMCEIEEEGADTGQAAARIRAKLERLGIALDQVAAEPVAALIAASLERGGGAGARGLLRPGAKVYFCGSIRGGRQRQPLYKAIVDDLQERGCRVLTTHVAAPDVLALEWREGVTARDIYERDLRWLEECDVVIAEVSTPSLGVGVEIAEATRLGKPIVALYEGDGHLSAMVAGNPAVDVITYRSREELFARLAVLAGDAEASRGR